ncbi:NUDIX hydrolase [Sediminibacterium sp.]|uniref:NUDIX hydrolase n=1 Tax=Sediminibacterium sp. TaxID=1917865 RepID=UPI003F72B97F
MQKDIKQWSVLQSNIGYTKKWLKIKEDICQLPDGRIIDPYIVIDVPNFCNIFMVTPSEEIVMVKQYRHAAGIITIELPGGMIESNEDPMVAAKREMEEETGYQTDEFELLYSVHPNPPLESNYAYFYLAKAVQPKGKTAYDPYEDIEIVLVPKEDFMKQLLAHSFKHGAQIGAMYAAAIKLGWLKA